MWISLIYLSLCKKERFTAAKLPFTKKFKQKNPKCHYKLIILINIVFATTNINWFFKFKKISNQITKLQIG